MIARGDFVPTRPDAPALELDDDFWASARVVMPPHKERRR